MPASGHNAPFAPLATALERVNPVDGSVPVLARFTRGIGNIAVEIVGFAALIVMGLSVKLLQRIQALLRLLEGQQVRRTQERETHRAEG